MTEEEKTAVFEFVLNRFRVNAQAGRECRDSFRAWFRSDRKDDRLLMSQLLEEVRLSKDSEQVELALNIGGMLDFADEHLEQLCELLREDWHRSHEGLVAIIDDYQSPLAVKDLYEAATRSYPYLCSDEVKALTRRAAFALGKIWNEEAKARLREMAAAGRSNWREVAEEQFQLHHGAL